MRKTLFYLGLYLPLMTGLASVKAQCPATLTVTNGNTGTWTNTSGGNATVRITAIGGGGGKNTMVTLSSLGQVGTLFGGSGATMEGTFVVPPGVTLFAISGKAGESTSNAGSGGGGSGVVSCGNPQDCANGTILILAGGGGGTSGFTNGQGGQITQGSGSGGSSAGANAAGGGGLNSAGEPGGPTQGTTAIAFGGGQVSKVAISNGGAAGTVNGSTGAVGGNGMGGGGGTHGGAYASGAGGYTGGDGENDTNPAKGGGSINTGTAQNNTPGISGGGANVGSVTIECLSVIPGCSTPTAFAVTGGGAYCSGGAGVSVGLADSEIGVNYQLKVGGVNTGVSLAGSGNPLSFGNQTNAGTYTVEATTATGGCTNTMTGNVSVAINPTPPTPTLANTPAVQTVCPNGSATLSATGSMGGTIWWYWFSGTIGGIIDSTNTNPLTVSPTATRIYYAGETTSAGCRSAVRAPARVNISALPTAKAGPDRNVCKGSNASIGTAALSGHTYTWSPTTGLSNPYAAQTSVLAPQSTITYSLSVKNALGCMSASSDQVVVTVNNPPVANAGPNQSTCKGTSATLGVSPVAGYTYTWIPSANLNSAFLATPIANTSTLATTNNFILTVRETATGCTSKDTMTLTVNPLPPTLYCNAGLDITIVQGGAAQIGGANSVTGYTYTWTPSTGLSNPSIAKPLASPTSTTIYSLSVANSFGCSRVDDMTLTVNSPRYGAESEKFEVYPNPVKTALNLVSNQGLNGKVEWVLSNELGQEIIKQRKDMDAEVLNAIIQMDGLPSGIYFLTISTQAQTQMLKVVKE